MLDVGVSISLDRGRSDAVLKSLAKLDLDVTRLRFSLLEKEYLPHHRGALPRLEIGWSLEQGRHPLLPMLIDRARIDLPPCMLKICHTSRARRDWL